MDETPRASSSRPNPVKVYGGGASRPTAPKRASRARAADATKAERERVVRAGVDRMLDEIGFFGTLKLAFGLWDVLWFGLAISSAFKVAQGG